MFVSFIVDSSSPFYRLLTVDIKYTDIYAAFDDPIGGLHSYSEELNIKVNYMD